MMTFLQKFTEAVCNNEHENELLQKYSNWLLRIRAKYLHFDPEEFVDAEVVIMSIRIQKFIKASPIFTYIYIISSISFLAFLYLQASFIYPAISALLFAINIPINFWSCEKLKKQIDHSILVELEEAIAKGKLAQH